MAVVPASAGTEPAAPEAAFEQRSYAPGATAQLIVWHGSAQTVRIHRVGDLGGPRRGEIRLPARRWRLRCGSRAGAV